MASPHLLTPKYSKLNPIAGESGERMNTAVNRMRLFVGTPGYSGHIKGYHSGTNFNHFSGNFHSENPLQPGDMNKNSPRKMSDLPFLCPAELYPKKTNPLVKTNVKNRSAVVMGDERDQFWETTYNHYTTPIELTKRPTHQPDPLVLGWLDLEPHQRRLEYDKAMSFVGGEGVKELEMAIKSKMNQRGAGGTQTLRKALKQFDMDGSGDIDPDEFRAAMNAFGVTFTERQVLRISSCRHLK